MDISLIEELAFLAIKKVFPDGIRLPIRREGVADFDLTIKGKEIVIDFNNLVGDVPHLAVWRVTFAYRGETLAVWGRGVKRELKVHPFRVLRLMVRLWWQKRNVRKKFELQARREAAARRALANAKQTSP